MSKDCIRLFLLASALTTSIVLGAIDEELSPLQIVNGTCHYRNCILEKGIKYQKQDPCEEWECKPESNELIIKGCALGTQYSSCIPRNGGRFPWPHCCHYRNYC